MLLLFADLSRLLLRRLAPAALSLMAKMMKPKSKRKTKTKPNPRLSLSIINHHRSMLLFRGKKRIADKNRAISEGDVEEPGHQELQTFLTVDKRIEEAEVIIIGDRIPDWERSELEFEISQEVINLDALQRIASRGHLDGARRALVWKLLLFYLPVEKDVWEVESANSRLRYADLKAELLVNPSAFSRDDDSFSLTDQDGERDLDGPLCRYDISNRDHPLSHGSASMWHQYFKNAEIVEQIDRDLQRTHPDINFFSGDSALSKHNKVAMRNILLLFAKLNPTIGYVQGMNEILAPLYYVFRTDPDEQNASNAEADSFACFVRLLTDSIDHFCQQLDNSSVGILATLSQLSELLKANDEELWLHLEISKVKVQFYAFRWITLLLTQEFKFHSIMRIWDSLLSNPMGVQEKLLRICCAMLLNVRHELLNGDFASNLRLLQHYPQHDIENVLVVAQKLTPPSLSPRPGCVIHAAY